MNWGTRTEHVTTCQVLRAVPGSRPLEVVAEFYAYGKTKQWREDRTEQLAAIFMEAIEQKKKPSAKLRQMLRAAIIAVHKGAVRWNDSRSKGYRLAGLIALLTDGLLDPWHYLTGGGSK